MPQRFSPLGPLLSPVLIEELRKRFPNQVPDISTPDREVWAKVGEQRLLAFLQAEFDTAFGRDDDS